MLRVTLDVNGKVIGELKIVRDLTDNDRVRGYTVTVGRTDLKCRLENFDSKLGPWKLAAAALEAAIAQSSINEERIIEFAEQLKNERPGLCSVCREPQFETMSGTTCKNGHGGAPALEA